MKRFPVLGVALLLPAIALFLAVGCKNDAKTTTTPTKPTEVTETKKIDAPGDAKVKGVVTLKGEYKPEEDGRIKTALKEAKDTADCMAGGGNHILKQEWLVGNGNGLANVLVTIDAPSGSEYKIDAKFRDEFKEKKVYLDQPYCAYVTHVSGVYAGVQPFVVKNSGKIAHNTNIQPGPSSDNLPKNESIAGGATWEPITFKYQRKPLDISCQQHSFMTAKVVTVKHPFFAVTDKDGNFEIDRVPSGTELVINVWHESMSAPKEHAKKKFDKGENKLDKIELSK